MSQDRNLISVPGTDRTFHRYKILAVLLVPLSMSLIAISSINVALSSIGVGLGASSTDLQWVLSGYALAFGVCLVPAGRLGDVMGRGTLHIIGLALFTLGSLACGLATDPLVLNLARVIQGVGAGLFNPQTMGMIQQYFSGQGRAKAFSLFGMVVSVSVAIGPVFAGTIIRLLGPAAGWRWSFLAIVPMGVVGIVLALWWLPFETERARRAASRNADVKMPERKKLDLDPVGALLLTGAILGIMMPFTLKGNPSFWLLLPAALVLLLIWVRWEGRYKRRGGEPMVDLALFRYSSFTLGTMTSTFQFLGSTSIFVTVAMFLQTGLHASAFAAGLIGLPNALASAWAAMWSGRRALRMGRPIVIGSLLLMVASLLASIVVVWAVGRFGLSFWWLLLTLGTLGLGMGAIGSANQTLTMQNVPIHAGGTAGGVKSAAERTATAIGNAMITAVYFGVTAAKGPTAGFMAAYLVICAILLTAAAVAIRDRKINGNGTSLH
ncbi:MFS transporter [Luteococcus sp. Sow4_B9]|uniref:MFS transporter n=1 Tax=Luteococcus sp. Sow4_B9 TaxID=3438792 RepID=UPI003F96B21D